MGELRQQHQFTQRQCDKQLQELLKLSQRLELLRKCKMQYEAKALRTAAVSEECSVAGSLGSNKCSLFKHKNYSGWSLEVFNKQNVRVGCL